MFKVLRSYFWPNPPKKVSIVSQEAMKADLHAKGLWSACLEDNHRAAVEVWTRHADNLARSENRAWFRKYGVKFVRRWTAVACIAWALAWAASDSLRFEIPFSLLGAVAVVIAIAFQYLRKAK